MLRRLRNQRGMRTDVPITSERSISVAVKDFGNINRNGINKFGQCFVCIRYLVMCAAGDVGVCLHLSSLTVWLECDTIQHMEKAVK